MTAKFAVALIATTMFVAPAFAADAVNPAAPAANAPAAATPAPQGAAASKATAATTAVPTGTGKPAVDASHKGKKLTAAHRRSHHTMTAHKGKPYVKTVKVERSVKVVKSNQPAWPFGPFTWTTPDRTVGTMNVVHHHSHHTVLAHGGKSSTAVKTAHTSKPTKTEGKSVGAAPVNAPAGTASTAGKTDGDKGDVKVIKADKDLKNGAKVGKDSKTTGQSAQGSPASTGKINKDSGKVN